MLPIVCLSLSIAWAAPVEESAASDDQKSIGLIAEISAGEAKSSLIGWRPAFWLREFESPTVNVPPENWSVAGHGWMSVRVPGRYRFAAVVLGRLELRVDGRTALAIDSGDSEIPLVQEGTAIELPAGDVQVRVEFSKIAGRPAVLRLLRGLPDGFQESLSPSAFWHDSIEETNGNRSAIDFARGMELISQWRCIACHRANEDAARRLLLNGHLAALLADVVQGVRADWLWEFLSEPRRAKSHATMPRLFGDGDGEDLDRTAVWRYLVSLNQQRASVDGSQQDPQPSTLNSQPFDAGRDRFVRMGCVACHLVPGEKGDGDGRLTSLDHVPRKFMPGELRRRWRGGFHQPRLDLRLLSEADVAALEHFLLTPADATQESLKAGTPDDPTDDAVRERFRLLVDDDAERAAFDAEETEQRLVRLGRHVVQRRGCEACHRASQEKPLDHEFFEWKMVLDKIRETTRWEGCLAEEPPQGVPDFEFTPSERDALAHALRELANVEQFYDAPLERLETSLQRLGCKACHERNGRPSVLSRRIETFAVLGRDQTVRDVVPPSLDGVGERLTPAWLRKVLVDHQRVRPWLDVKMPLYDAADVEPLIELLIRADGLDLKASEAVLPRENQKQLEGARLLVGRTGLNCVGCHDFGEHRATGVRAPDLASVGERLRFDWFRRWLHDPQAVAPGTRMPTIFHRGQSVLPQVLGGREQTQVAALWSYLSQKNDRVPPLLPLATASSVSGETDTPIPTDGPLLIHGFMPNHAGLRGVALGFPSGLHFAWDTEACRLTRVWRGPFVHQAGWQGSGKGGVEAIALSILGDILWRDDGGPAIWCATGVDSSFPKTAPVLRFDECWATRTEAGFAWRVTSPSGEFRMEERLAPLPSLGETAFQRTVTIDGLPAETGLWQRIFAGVSSEVEVNRPDSVPSGWLRLPSGTHDWLICVNGTNVESSSWFVEHGDRGRGSADHSSPGMLYLRIPPQERRRQLTLDVVSLRVERGASPPMDREAIFPRRNESP